MVKRIISAGFLMTLLGYLGSNAQMAAPLLMKRGIQDSGIIKAVDSLDKLTTKADTTGKGKILKEIKKMVEDAKKAYNVLHTSYGLFPIKNDSIGNLFWGSKGGKALNSVSVNAWKDDIKANIELFSDELWVFRYGIGATISSNSNHTDSTHSDSLNNQTSSFNQLVQSGGLLNVSISWPILYKDNIQNDLDKLNWFFAILLNGRAGWDSPQIDSMTHNPGFSGTLGIEADYFRDGRNHTIGFELGFLANEYTFNNVFAHEMAVSSNNATVCSYRIGAVIADKTRFGLVGPIYVSEPFKQLFGLRAYVQQIF